MNTCAQELQKYGEFSANQWFGNHYQSISPYGSGTSSENYHSFNHSFNPLPTTQTMGKSLQVLFLCKTKISYLAEEHYARSQIVKMRKERNNSRQRGRVRLMNSSLNALENETSLRSGEKVLPIFFCITRPRDVSHQRIRQI